MAYKEVVNEDRKWLNLGKQKIGFEIEGRFDGVFETTSGFTDQKTGEKKTEKRYLMTLLDGEEVQVLGFGDLHYKMRDAAPGDLVKIVYCGMQFSQASGKDVHQCRVFIDSDAKPTIAPKPAQGAASTASARAANDVDAAADGLPF